MCGPSIPGTISAAGTARSAFRRALEVAGRDRSRGCRDLQFAAMLCVHARHTRGRRRARSRRATVKRSSCRRRARRLVSYSVQSRPRAGPSDPARGCDAKRVRLDQLSSCFGRAKRHCLGSGHNNAHSRKPPSFARLHNARSEVRSASSPYARRSPLARRKRPSRGRLASATYSRPGPIRARRTGPTARELEPTVEGELSIGARARERADRRRARAGNPSDATRRRLARPAPGRGAEPGSPGRRQAGLSGRPAVPPACWLRAAPLLAEHGAHRISSVPAPVR